MEKREELTGDERDRMVAGEILAGRCPFGYLKPGQSIAHCPLGFPGCGCADELYANPYLQETGQFPADGSGEKT